MIDLAATEYAVLAAVSAVSGVIGGMSGLALGTMRLPVMLFLGIDPLTAAGTNMGVGMFGSVAGSWEHLRSGRVVLRVVFVMGLPAVLGTFIGAAFADLVPAWALLIAVSVLILWSATTLIVRAISPDKTELHSRSGYPVHPGRQRVVQFAKDSAVSATIGILGGAVGLLLAMLRMPALINLMKLAPGQAVGTNTAIGVLIGLFGLGGHLIGGNVSWPLLGVMGGAAVVGFFLGARLTGAIKADRLRLVIGIVLLCLVPVTLINGISEMLNG